MVDDSTGFLIPWGYLKDRDVNPNKKAMIGSRKTFAQALENTCGISLSQLPTPCIKGDMVVVQVEEEDYLAGWGLQDSSTWLDHYIFGG